MVEATNIQMQSFCDQRLRIRAEQIRALYLACKDDKLSLDDVYARSVGINRWEDNRTDGPPHILESGNGANPDDIGNYNEFITDFIEFIELTKKNSYAVLIKSCVRPIGS